MVMVMMMVVVSLTNGHTTPSQCKQERTLICNAFSPVMFGLNPLAACYERVRVTHVECVCPSITPRVAVSSDPYQNQIQQIESCGRRVPYNFKCGSNPIYIYKPTV